MESEGTKCSLPKNRKGFVRKTFQEFCEGSTFPGINYLVAKDRNWFERFCWLVATVLCIAASSFLIRRIWIRWNNSPIIISPSEKATPIWEIPFPAITICSETKSLRSKFNFTKVIRPGGKDLTEEELKYSEVVSMVCNYLSETGIEESSDIIDEEHVNFLDNISDTNMLYSCVWYGKEKYNQPVFNRYHFHPVMTEEGLCYTTNALNHNNFYAGEGLNSKYLRKLPEINEWNPEDGYTNKSDLHKYNDYYPKNDYRSGRRSGILLTLETTNADLDHACQGEGYKVFLHSPAETPIMSEKYFSVPLRKRVELSVDPKVVKTDQNLLNSSPERRQCYRPYERKLAFFKVYTKHNCEFECYVNKTLHCGCVTYYMPRSNRTSVCGRERRSCIDRALASMIDTQIESAVNGSLESCNCLPPCTSIQYDAETVQTEFFPEDVYRQETAPPDSFDYLRDGKKSFSQVRIFFKNQYFVASGRHEIYSYPEFLADCGGVLGICCGFCLFSLFEIIYYATIRLFIHKKREQVRMPNKENSRNYSTRLHPVSFLMNVPEGQ